MMDLKTACDRIRLSENAEVASIVIHDKSLQRVLAVWPMVKRDELPVSITSDMSFSDLWSAIRFDEREAVDLSGLQSGIGISALRRAMTLRLIYPDGTVHKYSAGVLRVLINDTLKGKK